MNNLLVRALAGAVFVSIILASIIYDPLAAAAVLTVFMILGLIEFYKLFNNHKSIQIDWRLGTLIGTLLFGLLVGIIFEALPLYLWIIAFPLLFLMIVTELWRKKENPILNIAVQVMGIFYVVVPFVLLIYANVVDQFYTSLLIEQSFLFPLIAGFFLLIWANDTFAYLNGRLFGKNKLMERVSPNKTWEGTIGGIVFTIGVGVLFAYAIPTIYSPTFWIVAAIIVAPCAIVGDLLESLIKRSLNIKDTGTIMPGHGGILDRFDSTLFAIPFFVAWTYIYSFL